MCCMQLHVWTWTAHPLFLKCDEGSGVAAAWTAHEPFREPHLPPVPIPWHRGRPQGTMNIRDVAILENPNHGTG